MFTSNGAYLNAQWQVRNKYKVTEYKLIPAGYEVSFLANVCRMQICRTSSHSSFSRYTPTQSSVDIRNYSQCVMADFEFLQDTLCANFLVLAISIFNRNERSITAKKSQMYVEIYIRRSMSYHTHNAYVK